MPTPTPSIFGHIARKNDDADASMILTAPCLTTAKDHQGVPYHVAEHRPARSESLQPHTERSSRPGPEPSSVNAEVTTLWRCTNTFNIIIIIIIIMALRTPSGACQKRRKRTSTDKYFSTTSLRG